MLLLVVVQIEFVRNVQTLLESSEGRVGIQSFVEVLFVSSKNVFIYVFRKEKPMQKT